MKLIISGDSISKKITKNYIRKDNRHNLDKKYTIKMWIFKGGIMPEKIEEKIEEEILKFLARGYSSSKIAIELGTDERGVIEALRILMHKTGAKNRIELIIKNS